MESNMKTISIIKCFFLLLMPLSSSLGDYTNITPAEVHTRLVNGDTLIVLDVREVVEYVARHIAEPEGQLPLTPVNIPYSSGVLAAECDRLPRDVDIIVHCASGGRSALASAFLVDQGFTLIYNMTGGFRAWTFEAGIEGYGDHSGEWIRPADTLDVTIPGISGQDTSRIGFSPGAIPVADSIYIELHHASSLAPIPQDVPESELEGLFRVTVLDPFGLSLFIADSLALADTIGIRLFPRYPAFKTGSPYFFANEDMTVFIPGEGWRPVPYSFDGLSFYREETTLRRWYNVQGSGYTGVNAHMLPEQIVVALYPNPFNDAVKIIAPANAQIVIYDIRGRLIQRLQGSVWTPDRFVQSGLYFIQVQVAQRTVTKRAVYVK